jgi:hypothetical protein
MTSTYPEINEPDISDIAGALRDTQKMYVREICVGLCDIQLSPNQITRLSPSNGGIQPHGKLCYIGIRIKFLYASGYVFWIA